MDRSEFGFFGSCWRNVNAMLVPLQPGMQVYASDNDMSYANIMSAYDEAAAYRWDA